MRVPAGLLWKDTLLKGLRWLRVADCTLPGVPSQVRGVEVLCRATKVDVVLFCSERTHAANGLASASPRALGSPGFCEMQARRA